MSVRWRAWYSDTEWTEEPYHKIDRSRLVRFSIYADPYTLTPCFSVDVPVNRRLVYRTRHFVGGVNGFLVIVGLEDTERNADVWVINENGQAFYMRHYDPTHAETRAPVLLPFEVSQRELTTVGASAHA